MKLRRSILSLMSLFPRFKSVATAPGIECVIHDHSALQLFVIVAECRREPVGEREQARRLGCELGPAGIRPAHDQRQMIERLIANAVNAQESVETALVTGMPEFDARDIV